MAAELSAGLACGIRGIPVRPDLLGQRLQDYAEVAPTLHTLRLCHSFGKGPDVHVTKLPAELEQEIESLLVQAQRDMHWFDWDWERKSWEEKFDHYEGRCAPMDHMPDCYSPLADQASDDLEMCAACEDEYGFVTANCLKRCLEETEDKCYPCSHNLGHESCQRTCDGERNLLMNEMSMDWDMNPYNASEEDCEGWEKAINQAKDGHFAQYDKILRRDFGIEAFFSKTRMPNNDEDSWPRHRNQWYHLDKGLKTTVCYLTMRRTMVPSRLYCTTDMEDDCGFIDIEATRVLPITLGDVEKTKEKARKLFRRALRILGLQPFVHPSQRVSLILSDSGDDKRDDGMQKKDKGQDEAEIKWPALISIVKADFSM